MNLCLQEDNERQAEKLIDQRETICEQSATIRELMRGIALMGQKEMMLMETLASFRRNVVAGPEWAATSAAWAASSATWADRAAVVPAVAATTPPAVATFGTPPAVATIVAETPPAILMAETPPAVATFGTPPAAVATDVTPGLVKKCILLKKDVSIRHWIQHFVKRYI
jgi:hypothetical protein